MRYLQGDAIKREPAAVPEQTYPDDWKPAQAPSQKIYSEKEILPAPSVSLRKKQHLRWPIKRLSFFKNMRIAIAVFALVVLLFAFWKGYVFYKLTPESIFTKTYVPFVNANKSRQAEKNSIGYYYETGNYVAATMQSKKQLQLSDKEKLLTGLAYLHRDDYSAAIKKLEPVSNNFKSPYRQQAEYYLALAYLKNEDYDRCIEKMELIAYTPSHPYHNQISEATISDIKMLKWK